MKKGISTIVAIAFISSMLVTTAFAGQRHGGSGHGGGIDPVWIPVAILSTIAAVLTISDPPPVVYERREYQEPRQVVVYEESHHHRHDHYCNHNHEAEMPRYRDYR